MLYDLNIPWTPSTTPAALECMLTTSRTLGYNLVALNHTIEPPVPSQIHNPLPKFDDDKQPSKPAPASSSTATPPSPPPSSSSSSKPRFLHRATVILTDPGQNHRLSSILPHYDLLAVRPTTEKAFSTACLSLYEPCLISLDLSVRLPFLLRPKTCMAAVSRGQRFEICYGQNLLSSSSSSDAAHARATFISNMMSLVRATKGRGLVVSSEAKSSLGLRAPECVVNLMKVWGLEVERGREALRDNPRGVVVNEGLKRSSFRGVVNIIQVGVDGRREEEGTQKQKKDGLGAGHEKGAKRKGGQDGEQPISKRQAKKLRLAQREKKAAGGDGKT